jgi:hypothetical protein
MKVLSVVLGLEYEVFENRRRRKCGRRRDEVTRG